jgi:hypothetical protein
MPGVEHRIETRNHNVVCMHSPVTRFSPVSFRTDVIVINDHLSLVFSGPYLLPVKSYYRHFSSTSTASLSGKRLDKESPNRSEQTICGDHAGEGHLSGSNSRRN